MQLSSCDNVNTMTACRLALSKHITVKTRLMDNQRRETPMSLGLILDAKGGFTMTLLNLFLIAVGLSMDAFAVSVCKGLAMEKAPLKKAALAGIWFGSFQALMPLIGYLLGSRFEKYITSIDHWIAFILLALIGGNMIKEAFSKNEEETSSTMYFKEMFLLAVATSIDALAVGITFAFLRVNILSAVGLIGITTFTLSIVGVKVGNLFGSHYKSRAELAGGVLLILMGIKILLEHLGIL